MDKNTLVVTDQLERELIWDALERHRSDVLLDPAHQEALDALIKRVMSTFSWMRES